MKIRRATAVELASCACVAAVAGTCHYFGLGELPGLLGTGFALVGAAAHAGVGHTVVDLVKGVAERAGEETVRGAENRDLHRLIGEAIARMLEREATSAPVGQFGAAYLNEAAEAFRGDRWMNVELTGPETAVSEPNLTAYFTDDAEKIHRTPVLEHAEWTTLVQKVAGGRTQIKEHLEALDYAASKLRYGFAFEIWETAKDAWKNKELAWPALNLRLLGVLWSRVGGVAEQVAGLSKQIAQLVKAIGKAANAAESAASPAYQEMLRAAIRKYQDELNAKLDRNFQRVLDDLAEVKVGLKAALANPRTSRVKEPLINLPNTTKEILARDAEARQLLEALRLPGPGIVSIAAPPGFGKSAVFALALRMALPNGDARAVGLDGIAVLDAKAAKAGIASFAGLLGRVTGLHEIAARFTYAEGRIDLEARSLFFDLLRMAGKVWLVIENAEQVLAPSADTGAADFRELLNGWCKAGHQAKLLLLTRHAVQAAPECHRSLRNVEKALLGGLPEDAAVELLRQRLVDTRFHSTSDSLLRQIAQRLHRVPMALEQFAGYLHWNEQGIELDQRFLETNDLLRLRASDPMEDLLLRVIAETLKLLDPSSRSMLAVVAWAGMPVPLSGLMALTDDGAPAITRLVRSNLLIAREGTAAGGRSFDMHPLVREALEEPSGIALDFSRITRICRNAGYSEWKRNQFRPALSLYVLAERAARSTQQGDDLAAATMNRGTALWQLGRLEEALAADKESIDLYRGLVENEHRQEFRNDLAAAILSRGSVLHELERPQEALAASEESINLYRVLVENEHRQELRNDLAAAIMNRGSALLELGRLEEALAASEESINLYRVLVENQHRQELRNALAAAIINRGSALQELGRLEDAVTAYEESIWIRRTLVEDEHRQEFRNDLAAAILSRGSVLQELERPQDALGAYDESIGLYRVLVENEHRQELLDGLAMAIMNRGSALADLGRLEEATTAYEESIRIRRALVEDEHRQELRDRLAMAITNRGMALWQLGRLKEALAAYRESIDLYRVLVEDEHRLELRNDLATSYYNLSVIREDQGAVAAALDAVRRARHLWEDMAMEGMDVKRQLMMAKACEAGLSGHSPPA